MSFYRSPSPSPLGMFSCGLCETVNPRSFSPLAADPEPATGLGIVTFFSFLFFFGQIPPGAILRETINYFCTICFILRSDLSFLNPADLYFFYFIFYFFLACDTNTSWKYVPNLRLFCSHPEGVRAGGEKGVSPCLLHKTEYVRSIDIAVIFNESIHAFRELRFALFRPHPSHFLLYVHYSD